MKRSALVAAALGSTCLLFAGEKMDQPSVITVDPKAVAVERFLGFGAEWDPNFWAEHNVQLGVTEDDWAVVVKRIQWMKLPVVRMMIQARWCTKGDGKFDWDTPNMKSLYRHLDVCQKAGIRVFLTDWGVATWCKVPGFSGNDDPKYADAIGTYLGYLIGQKGYTCIKHFILVNEPNYEGGGWDRWKKGVENVAKVLAERKLPVTFVGTDAAHDDGWHRKGVDQLAKCFSIWEIHRYAPQAEVLKGDLEGYFRKQWDYARANDLGAHDKLFMVGEAGMREGMVSSHTNTNIHTYDYGVFMADYGVQAARSGAAAVSAWMLDDSSHKGFNWGLWKTKAEGMALKPWFYPWALLCRFVRPGSTIYRLPQPNPRCRLLAARVPPKGATESFDTTYVLVNRGDAEVTVRLKLSDGDMWPSTLVLYLYSRASAPADKDGFPVPVKTVEGGPGESVPVTCPPDAVLFVVCRTHRT
ncbi:MAG TPA: hypothetical protein VNE39_04025 [Planctomycetota bacterium]|nr:hypothetical protein [Planctomycetota bacterium]